MQNLSNLCMGCMSETGNEQVCSVCGFDSNTYNEAGALLLRTLLAGRYAVGKAVSVTGEGFNYIGFDTVTESVVKIAEYFPAGLCGRNADGSVEIKGDTAYVYNEGIIRFIELNKKLGALANVSALYRVIDIFEVNKTAYAITEYQPGISLKEFLIRNGGLLTWDQVRPLFLPLMNSLKTLHENGIVHGGISVDTLFVGRDGKVRIADFLIPAARNARSQMTAQLYPGFAAVEQYRGEDITPATDIYGFAATMFRTLTGNTPPDSKLRLESDNLSFPRSIAEKMPRSVLVAMANALQVEATDRTPTMAEFKNDLQAAESYVNDGSGKPKKAQATKGSNKKYTLFAALATAVLLAIIGIIVYFSFFSGSDEDVSSAPSLPTNSVESYHTIDASSTPEKQQSTPDFSGKTLPELIDEYGDWYEFEVVKKEYNSKIERGKICAQSVKIGTVTKKGTKVQLTVSLGNAEVKIPKSLSGMTKDQALIELLKLGFEYNNIEFMEKMGDTQTKEQVVIETAPAMGEKVSPDERITVYYNTNILQEQTSSEEDLDW